MARTTRLAIAISLLAVLAAAPFARADVYKCSGAGGVPMYQEEPCPKGKELRNFQTDPPDITVLPATPRADTIPPAKNAAKAASAEKPNGAKQGKSLNSGDASERKFIRTGMTEAEVLAKLGQPDMTVGGKNGKPARWTYMPAPGDPEMITSVTLSQGSVTEVDRKAVRK
jgi:hypothetical protein